MDTKIKNSNTKSAEIKTNIKTMRWNVENTSLLIEKRIERHSMFSVRTLSNSGWQVVLSDLKNMGLPSDLSLAQIKKKWSNICAKYKEVKENNKNQEKNWPHFNILDEYFNKASNNVTLIKNYELTEKRSDKKSVLVYCRLCQEMEGVYSLNKDSHLCVQIMECTSLKIHEDASNLPHGICEQCKTLVSTFHKFLLQCRMVDKKLRDAVAKSENTHDSNELNLYNCEKCPMSLNSKDAFEQHMVSHRKNQRFECEICKKSFSRLSTLSLHSKKHDENKGCVNKEKIAVEEDFAEINNEEMHCKEENELDENKTENSDENFDKTENKFYCDLCSKTFDRHCDLNIHLDTHIGVTHMCPRQDCNKTYTSLNSLRIHERKHLGLNSFLCVSCGKGFVTKNALKCHEKIHQEIKEYICNVCSRGFSVVGNLRTHQKKHHQGHRFYCSKCPRAFLAKCSLERHELVHSGVKEFSCDSCNAAFYTSKELTKHKKYHQGLRSFHCNQCFKTFFEKHHLTVHMRCHTGERPYTCKIPGCEKSFRESQKLSRHMKRHH